MTVYTLAAATICGLVVGSFLTVVTERVPQRVSIVRPRSRCAACGTVLGAVDLVPVASWLLRRGRCRHCAATIGVGPLAHEMCTASLFAALVVRHGVTWQTAAFAVLAAALVTLSAIDLAHRRLPREISYSALALSLPLLAVATVLAGEPWRMADIALAAVLGTAAMGTLHLISRGGLGDGDVRLTPLLCANLGWFGAHAVVYGLLGGFVLGAAVGVGGMLIGRLDRRSELPFGPFLAAGTLLTVLLG